ncbi:ABC transporter, partial [Mycobacterium tuberculosis]
MVLQPVGIGMKKDEPVLLSKVNAALYALEKSGELDRIWAKWLGPNTEYKMTREEKVTPLAELKFEMLP